MSKIMIGVLACWVAACGQEQGFGGRAHLQVGVGAVGGALAGALSIKVAGQESGASCVLDAASVEKSERRERHGYNCSAGNYLVSAIFKDAAGKLWSSAEVPATLLANASEIVELKILVGDGSTLTDEEMDQPILMAFSHPEYVAPGTRGEIAMMLTSPRQELEIARCASSSDPEACARGSFAVAFKSDLGAFDTVLHAGVVRMQPIASVWTAPAVTMLTKATIQFTLGTFDADGSRLAALANFFTIIVDPTGKGLTVGVELRSPVSLAIVLGQPMPMQFEATVTVHDADLATLEDILVHVTASCALIDNTTTTVSKQFHVTSETEAAIFLPLFLNAPYTKCSIAAEAWDSDGTHSSQFASQSF
jgi:hypothetical protein